MNKEKGIVSYVAYPVAAGTILAIVLWFGNFLRERLFDPRPEAVLTESRATFPAPQLTDGRLNACFWASEAAKSSDRVEPKFSVKQCREVLASVSMELSNKTFKQYTLTITNNSNQVLENMRVFGNGAEAARLKLASEESEDSAFEQSITMQKLAPGETVRIDLWSSSGLFEFSDIAAYSDSGKIHLRKSFGEPFAHRELDAQLLLAALNSGAGWALLILAVLGLYSLLIGVDNFYQFVKKRMAEQKALSSDISSD
jgi:hypothetical protein